MKPLVCLHGFTGGPESWDAVLAGIPNVDARCPPLVGHDPAVPLAAASFEDEVDRLAGSLPRPVGDRYHLAGYSLGGRLALGLLVRHRELFDSATLIGVHPGLASERRRRERIAADEALARKLEEEGVEAFVDHWEGLALFETQRGLPREVLADQRTRRLEHRAEGLAHALRVLGLGRMPDYRGVLPQLDLPVHLMAGERDEKFCRLAEAMAEALPRGRVEVVPGVGHNLLLEAPGIVGLALLRALRRDEAGRPGLSPLSSP